jgi:N-formylmaleamate deformylase
MAAWQTNNVEVNGVRLHITRTNGNGPALVLVHGVTDDGLCWEPVAKLLETNYDVIMVDARGHGRSDAPESGYDLITLANDLHGVIQSLELDQPIVLGHSLGAVTTLVMSALHPDTPRAIALEDPPAWWVKTPDSEFLPRSTGILDWIMQLKTQTLQQILADGRIQNPLWSEAELVPWANSKLRVSAHAMKEIFTPNHSAGIVWDELLPRITCPTLVITADLTRGAALAPAGVAALKALVPQLRVEHIENAGHSIHREQFARYMQIVQNYLSESNG